MAYRVVVTKSAAEQFEKILYYVGIVLKNEQAFRHLLDDFDETCEQLALVADNIRLCDEPELAELGYRKIRFRRHNYLMLFAIDENIVRVDRIYHELQDYEKLK